MIVRGSRLWMWPPLTLAQHAADLRKTLHRSLPFSGPWPFDPPGARLAKRQSGTLGFHGWDGWKWHWTWNQGDPLIFSRNSIPCSLLFPHTVYWRFCFGLGACGCMTILSNSSTSGWSSLECDHTDIDVNMYIYIYTLVWNRRTDEWKFVTDWLRNMAWYII